MKRLTLWFFHQFVVCSRWEYSRLSTPARQDKDFKRLNKISLAKKATTAQVNKYLLSLQNSNSNIFSGYHLLRINLKYDWIQMFAFVPPPSWEICDQIRQLSDQDPSRPNQPEVCSWIISFLQILINLLPMGCQRSQDLPWRISLGICLEKFQLSMRKWKRKPLIDSMRSIGTLCTTRQESQPERHF